MPRLIGRLAEEPAIQEVEGRYETCDLSGKEGIVAATVAYRGQEVIFSNTELVGMFLDKLKMIANTETKVPVSDVVISVPAFFTEKERRALMDAAEIAGLNCLRTVNDTTAAAVNYGMMKSDVSAEISKTVVILDIGYASMKACAVSFAKGAAEIHANVYDMHLGGRDFDEVLVEHFTEQFIKVHKIDLRENKKALLRLRLGCERIKKILSGIQVTRLELEELTPGVDFKLEASRQQLEELAAPLLSRIAARLTELLQSAGLTAEQVDSIEVIGGTTRIPAVKTSVAQVFGKEVSTTLNADEAVSRGCALLCAMDSPSVRVREYKLVDVVNFPIALTCTAANGQSLGRLDLFPRGTPVGQVRPIILKVNDASIFPISTEAHYSDISGIPKGTPSQLARFVISAPKDLVLATPSTVTIDALVNPSSVIEVCRGRIELETIVESSTSVEEEDDAAPVAPERRVSIVQLSIKAETFRMPRPVMHKLKEAEINMALNDKLVAEIDDRRNAVEELIYEARNKMDETYSSVSSEEERDAVMSALSKAEDWLYNEGADMGKEAYVKKLEELKNLLKPFVTRLVEQARASSASTESTSAEFVKVSGGSDSINIDVPHMDMD